MTASKRPPRVAGRRGNPRRTAGGVEPVVVPLEPVADPAQVAAPLVAMPRVQASLRNRRRAGSTFAGCFVVFVSSAGISGAVPHTERTVGLRRGLYLVGMGAGWVGLFCLAWLVVAVLQVRAVRRSS